MFCLFIKLGYDSRERTNILISTHTVQMIEENYIYDTQQLDTLTNVSTAI